MDSICEIVRKNEQEYTRGNTHISKYVDFSMYDTISQIGAYLSSKHISGETDSLGREKPFFNISVAAANIWMRATDIDRKHIRIRATKIKDWLDSFIASVHLQDWMKKSNFAAYLNDWGRILARFGSAITKFVRNEEGLFIISKSWDVMIVDPIDFASNPKIEILELTEAQLYERVESHGYDEAAVKNLMTAITERETIDKRKKDNKTGYIKLYEVHGKLPLSTLKKAKQEEPDEDDKKIYVQQMHVVAFVGKRSGRQLDYQDFTIYCGREAKDPYRIDHLIKEDGRTLAIGAVEHLFEAQWMQNHAVKVEKDTLDISSLALFQTADGNFLNMNALDAMMSGDILIHGLNMPLTQINTAKYDITGMMNFRNSWKQLGNEINGISEAMLGASPKAGTAWRQVEAGLNESYSLFDLMTENKGIGIEEMMREWILPYIKTLMDSTEEVSATLDAHNITRIDGIYMKNEAINSLPT